MVWVTKFQVLNNYVWLVAIILGSTIEVKEVKRGFF